MKVPVCFDDRMVMMLHFHRHSSTFKLVSPDWFRANVTENFKSCIKAIQKYTEWKAARSTWVRGPVWIIGKSTSHCLATPRYKAMVFEMSDCHTSLEVKWEIWRTGRRICWHFIPWGQNQQNSFGSWYLKVVDLLTLCWLASMMKWWLYSSIFYF